MGGKSKAEKEAEKAEAAQKAQKAQEAEDKKKQQRLLVTTLKNRISSGKGTVEDVEFLADYEGRSRFDAHKTTLLQRYFNEGKTTKWYSAYKKESQKQEVTTKGTKRGYGTVWPLVTSSFVGFCFARDVFFLFVLFGLCR